MVMFAILCALIVLGRYFARHKGKAPGSAIILDHEHILEFKCFFVASGVRRD